MNGVFLSSPTLTKLVAAARELRVAPGHVLCVSLAEQGCPDLDDVVAALRPLDVPFFGGMFPRLIHDARQRERGALLFALPSCCDPLLIPGLQARDFDLPEFAGIAGAPEGSHTAVVYVDGLAKNVSRLLAELHGRLGNSVNYIGGGAGSLTLEQRPCVFTRDGAFQDAAVVTFVDLFSRLGVRHGWQRHAGPVVATRTRGNVICELNWRPACEVYREAVEPLLDEPLTAENFFACSAAFPFGIYKEGREDVVRDPIAVGENGELVCVGEVPENAVLNLLRGERSDLLGAAAQAGRDLRVHGAIRAHSSLVIDCISRTMFLGDEFERELATISEHIGSIDAALDVQGALTIGEISSQGDGFVDFLNKTIVAAVLYD